jgi:hypothetical protein
MDLVLPRSPLQVCLQDELRGKLIPYAFSTTPAGIRGQQETFRLLRRETFVPGNNLNRARASQACNKGECFLGLWTQRSVHIFRESDDDGSWPILG